MPKNKKKFKNSKPGTPKTQSGDDNSELNLDENASTVSNASTSMSYQELEDDDKSKGGEDAVEKIDNIEEQINKSLDGLYEKGFKEREEALKVLKKLFSFKYVIDHLRDRRFTLTEGLSKSLKRGKPNEQVLAAEVMLLTFIQFGFSIDNETFLSECKQMLVELIEDEKADSDVRQACVRTLAIAMFITNESSADLLSILDKLETIFSMSFVKGDGTLRTHASPKVYDLHSTSLSMWTFLISMLPFSVINKLTQKYINHFLDFLKSPELELRISAGETIALLFELAQCDSHSDLQCFKNPELLSTLKSLANDSAKYRSKKDKKVQRSSFRDVLRALDDSADFESMTIKFGTESLYLDNWLRKKQYDQFRETLGPGMNVHLQENEFLRDIFDLGAPIVGTDSNRKAQLNSLNHLQKTQFNKEQFRNRTKVLNKKRETKGNFVASATSDD